MRSIAALVAALIVLAGLAAIFAPDRLLSLGRSILTPTGLYSIGAVRVGIGLVFFLAGTGSRTPRTLRVLGFLVIVAGLATPMFGVDRSRAVLDWEAANGPGAVRLAGGFALVLGSFVGFAVIGSNQTQDACPPGSTL